MDRRGKQGQPAAERVLHKWPQISTHVAACVPFLS